MGDTEGQGSLACSSPWGHKKWHIATEQQQSLPGGIALTIL